MPGWRLGGLKEAKGIYESLRYQGRGFSRPRGAYRHTEGQEHSLCGGQRSYGTSCLCSVGAGEPVLPEQMGRPTGSRGGLEDLLTDRKRRYRGLSLWLLQVDFSMWQCFRMPGRGGGASQPQPLGTVPKVQAPHLLGARCPGALSAGLPEAGQGQ